MHCNEYVGWQPQLNVITLSDFNSRKCLLDLKFKVILFNFDHNFKVLMDSHYMSLA